VGKTSEELVGAVIWDVFPDHDPESRRALETVLATGSGATLTTHDRGGAWTEWTIFPVEEGLAVISRDITKREQVEESSTQSTGGKSESASRSRWK
jgi:hypothetical protein